MPPLRDCVLPLVWIVAFCPALGLADERAAAKPLVDLGAEVAFDKDGFVTSFRLRQGEKLSLDDFRTLGEFRHLTQLYLSGGRGMTDAHLAHLKSLDALERVTLDGVLLTDDGLRSLAGWKSLRKLVFYNITHRGKFNGSGMSHLAELPQFEEFACGGSSFDDAGLEACGRLSRLTNLQLWHTPITDAGVPHLTKLTRLRNLKLYAQWKPRITDAALPHLAKISTLETLSLGETRLSWDGGLSHLRGLSKLKELHLDQIDITSADLDRTRAELKITTLNRTPVAEKYREMFLKNFAATKLLGP